APRRCALFCRAHAILKVDTMDDWEFRDLADNALKALFTRLAEAGDRLGFEADFNSGALTVEFEDPPAKFVISPNAPVHQIWVSAHSKSFKLDWDSARRVFVLAATGQTLEEFITSAIAQQLGEEVTL